MMQGATYWEKILNFPKVNILYNVEQENDVTVNSSSACGVVPIPNAPRGNKHMKFGTDIDHKYNYTLRTK